MCGTARRATSTYRTHMATISSVYYLHLYSVHRCDSKNVLIHLLTSLPIIVDNTSCIGVSSTLQLNHDLARIMHALTQLLPRLIDSVTLDIQRNTLISSASQQLLISALPFVCVLSPSQYRSAVNSLSRAARVVVIRWDSADREVGHISVGLATWMYSMCARGPITNTTYNAHLQHETGLHKISKRTRVNAPLPRPMTMNPRVYKDNKVECTSPSANDHEPSCV